MSLIKMSCGICNYQGKPSEFENGEEVIQREVTQDDYKKMRNFHITKYKCPSCGNLNQSESPGSFIETSNDDEPEEYECENCGDPISEEEYEENHGRCNFCYESDEDEEND